MITGGGDGRKASVETTGIVSEEPDTREGLRGSELRQMCEGRSDRRGAALS